MVEGGQAPPVQSLSVASSSVPALSLAGSGCLGRRAALAGQRPGRFPPPFHGRRSPGGEQACPRVADCGRWRPGLGDVTMGATQGSAGSEPREPAGKAEQVGSLPRRPRRFSTCQTRPPIPRPRPRQHSPAGDPGAAGGGGSASRSVPLRCRVGRRMRPPQLVRNVCV